jgi:hypothetical protein
MYRICQCTHNHYTGDASLVGSPAAMQSCLSKSTAQSQCDALHVRQQVAGCLQVQANWDVSCLLVVTRLVAQHCTLQFARCIRVCCLITDST